MEPSLRCPSCGNHLQVVDAPSVTCPFCQTSVPVPAMYRPAQVQVIAPQPQNPYAANPMPPVRMPVATSTAFVSGAGCAGGVLVIVLVALMGMGAAFYLVLRHLPTKPSNKTTTASEPTVDEPEKPKPLVTFGGKGTGAGRMTDGRALTVGPGGDVWVAEYEDGHVLQFDKKGKFVRTIEVPPESPGGNIYISSLAADRAGHLFVARNGHVLRLSAEKGTVEKTFAGSSSVWNMTLDPGGGLWTGTSGDEYVHYDVEGKVLRRAQGLIAAVNKKDPAMSPLLAIDGKGRLFVASEMAGNVYVFDAELKYQNRFVVKDEQGKASSSLEGLAIDPAGRLYIGHYVSISVYDADGTRLRDVPGIAGGFRGFTFDDKGKLYVMMTAEQEVQKWDVAKD